MLSSQCISVTDLKKDTSKHIQSLKKDWSKIIFKNNKPVAVLVDIANFDIQIDEPFDFIFKDGVSPRQILSHFWR
jgi:hypothetical protein